MRWEYLVIRAQAGDLVRIFPPANFESEIGWIKSAVPHSEVSEYPIFPKYGHFPYHIIDVKCKGELKDMSGYIGWALVQGMGEFGWEMFAVQLSKHDQLFPGIGSYDHWTAFMRKQSEASADPELPDKPH